MKIKFIIYDYDENAYLTEKIEIKNEPVTQVAATNKTWTRNFWPHEIKKIKYITIENMED